MLPLLWMFGFAPWHGPSLAPETATLPVGPPAPHLDAANELGIQWTQSARWRTFTSEWPGQWAARWDSRTGNPRFLYAPGVDARDASLLLVDVARLCGVDPHELRQDKAVFNQDQTVLRWSREWNGAQVVGDEVRMVVKNGHIGGIWVRLSPVAMPLQPRPGEVVFPIESARGITSVLAQRREEQGVITWVDRLGHEVLRYTEHRYDSLDVSHLERTVGDAHVSSPARDLWIADLAGTSDTTAVDGSHSLTGTLTVDLDGPYLQVLSNGSSQTRTGVTPDESGLATLVGGTDISDASATVLAHTPVVFDWLTDRWPSHPWIGEKVVANVDISSGSCNAWYTSGTINFLVGSSTSCSNFGQIADVVYHEVGHGIHHYILTGGTFAGDVSEGSADYVSATITNDPILAPGSRNGTGYIRELDTDKVYPDDIIGEVHNDGLVWGSFLWNLRTNWQTTYGTEAGAEQTDRLFLGALSYGPTLTDLYEAVILSDDDNGDLSDGTPHACELVTLLDQHGLGPGPLGVVVIEHEALGPQSSTAPSYPVSFALFSPTEACSDLDLSSFALYMSTGPMALVPGIDDADPAVWSAWTEVPLVESGGVFTGEIPRQLATTEVHYFAEVWDTARTTVLRTHANNRAGVHSFRVGDRATVWCEDFEGGWPAGWSHGPGLPGQPRPDLTDEWEVGTPSTDGLFVPHSAVSGTSVVGTNIAGLYLPNNQQMLTSPPIPVPDGRMTLLTFQRFLTVEDGIYDRAELWADDFRLFENPSTPSGVAHTLDTDWKLVEIEADPLRAGVAADGEVVLQWTLTTDPGLEFGGWAIDDVCVVQLDDIPAHYRRMQLTAEVDDAFQVTLAWEAPWIAPLAGIQLVSIDEETLEDVSLASIQWSGVDVAPGEPGTFSDPVPLAPGDVRTYALVSAAAVDADGAPVWETALADGDNRVTVRRAADPIDTGEPLPEDSGDSTTDLPDEDSAAPTDAPDAATPEGEAKDGCGCSARPGWSGSWLLLVPAVVGLRRRRSR